MAGDHKCSVCQATFTRPQHVARHMRSHTGDKPYKCEFCGDQFARSDLLSRHVSKSHGPEIPIAGSSMTRKKPASRATTSKQSCDQCVESNLPCDGSKPCYDVAQPGLPKSSEADYAKYQSQAEYIRRLSFFRSGMEVSPPTLTTTLGWGSESSAASGLGVGATNFAYPSLTSRNTALTPAVYPWTSAATHPPHHRLRVEAHRAHKAATLQLHTSAVSRPSANAEGAGAGRVNGVFGDASIVSISEGLESVWRHWVKLLARHTNTLVAPIPSLFVRLCIDGVTRRTLQGRLQQLVPQYCGHSVGTDRRWLLLYFRPLNLKQGKQGVDSFSIFLSAQLCPHS